MNNNPLDATPGAKNPYYLHEEGEQIEVRNRKAIFE